MISLAYYHSQVWTPERERRIQAVLKPVLSMRNVLEPLTEIYGVPNVTIGGINTDLHHKLARAISCSRKAVSPRDKVYKTRMVKIKGKRKPQQYNAGKYNDSTLVWNTELLGPLPPPGDALAQYTS